MEKLVCILILVVAATNGQVSPTGTNTTTGSVIDAIMNVTGGMNMTMPPMSMKMACFQGSTVYYNGMVVENNRTSKNCEGEGPFSCVTYNTTHEDGYYAQSGVCAPTMHLEYYDCASASEYSGINFTSCNVSSCEGFACNKFMEPPECPQVTTQVVDVKVLPGCTMRNAINELGECVFPHMMQYPFQEQQMCRDSLSEMFTCVRKVALGCIGSPCHTPLDFIPDMLSTLQFGHYFITHHVTTLQDVMNMINNSMIEDLVYSYACPVPGEVPYLPTAEELNIGHMEIFVCDPYFVRDIVDAGLGFARQFYMARTQHELCGYFSAYMMKVEEMVTGRCDFSVVHHLISMIPAPYDRLVPVIHDAITVLEDMMSNLEMPACGAPPPMDLQCEKYNQSPRACDHKKAWICSLIDWRLNAVHPYIAMLFGWAETHGVQLGIEPQECFHFPENFCVHKGEMHCIMDPSSCRYCFCKDMELTNPGFMTTVYWKDFHSWGYIMKKYKMVLQNYDSCSPMHDQP